MSEIEQKIARAHADALENGAAEPSGLYLGLKEYEELSIAMRPFLTHQSKSRLLEGVAAMYRGMSVYRVVAISHLRVA